MTASREHLVVDASAAVTLLLDSGPDGDWVAERLRGSVLAAPHLMPFEVTNVVRRQVLTGIVTEPQARLALEQFARLPIRLWQCSLLAGRVWELRENATAYDASYLSLAEGIGATLVTADRRLESVPGVACPVEVVPESPS